MSPSKVYKLAMSIFLLSFSFNAMAADRIEIIQLKGRSANEMIPIIQPLLSPGAGLSGQGYKLIIRGSEQDIAQVREIIRQLDSPPKRLTISLRRGTGSTFRQNGISASATLTSGDTRVSVPDNGSTLNQNGTRILVSGNDSDFATVRIHETRGSINDNSIRRINVVEGRQAFIQTGQLVPVGERRVDQFGRQTNTVRYKNISSGFYVVPRLSGEFVNLELFQNHASIDRHGRQTFNIQSTGTTVRGRLGEWISIGGVSQQSTQSSSGTLYSTNRSSHTDLQLYIKVDVIGN